MKMLLCVLLMSVTAVLGHQLGDLRSSKLSPSENMIEMTKECGITKACHVAQKGCFSTNTCASAVTVVEEEGLYVFELMATSGVWVAVGLSDDNLMPDAAVVECVHDNVTNEVEAFVSWNGEGRSNDRISHSPEENLENGIVLHHSLYDNGFIYCMFTREPYTVVSNKSFDLISTPYHLLLASGTKLKPEGGVGPPHDLTYYGSPSPQLLHDIGMFDSGASMLQVFSFLIPAHVIYTLYSTMS